MEHSNNIAGITYTLVTMPVLLLSTHKYRFGRKEVVEYLLADGHANPNSTTRDGSTPLSRTSTTAIIRLLLQHGAVAADLYEYSSLLPKGSPREVAQSTVSVFVVGDKGAGKSTLTKALTTEREGIARLAGRLSKVSGVKERTAGIECHMIHSSQIGHLSLYDMAGHGEFHNAHDTVIRSSVSGQSSALFLFVAHMGASVKDLKQTVSYWLSFIQSQVFVESSAPEAKPYLLVVGSHADHVLSKKDLQEKERMIQTFCKDAENTDFVDYVRVDCRYSESFSLTQLRKHILATHDKLQQNIPQFSFRDHCFHVYLVSECGSTPGLQLKSLMKAIQHSRFSSREFLPQTMESLHEVCSNLNKRGVTLYIQTQSIESNWILIDRDLLLREVNGSIFAPDDFTEHKSLTQTGVVPFSKICTAFAQLIETKETDPQLIVDFLVHMEFCREITEKDLLQLVTETHTEYSSERHFLFPALTQQSPPRDLWQPQPHQYNSCWVLQCLDKHYLSPRFHQVLLLRLAFEHSQAVEAHKVAATSPALHQQCSLWRNGIKWSTDSSDVLVEISHRSVALYLSCRSEASNRSEQLQLVSTRAQVIQQILKAKAEFCGSVKTVEEFIPHPQYPVTIPSTSGISVKAIAQAICSGRKKVHTSPHDLVPVSELLCFEPLQFYNIQCLVDLYSDKHHFCKVTSSFIESVSSNISCVDDFCTLLNVPLHKVAVDSSSSGYEKAVRMFQEWQTQSEGTYQCIRQQMDKYSIFSGRTILVYAHLSILIVSYLMLKDW